MQKSKVKGGFSGPPALVFLISVLMIALMFIDFGGLPDMIPAYWLVIILHIVIFGVPALAYCFLRGKRFREELSLGRMKRSTFRLLPLATALLILQSCILKFGVFYFGYNYTAYTLYGSSFSVSASSAGEWILMVLSIAVVPAVTEELIFRLMIFSDYIRSCGFWCSAIASSLLFSFIHFDLAQFLIYFLDGLLLCWIVFLTGSVIPSIIAHTLYNVFVMFLEKYIWLFSSNPDSELLFWLIMIALWLLLLFFFFGRAEKITARRAEDFDSAPPRPEKDKLPAIYFGVFTSKPMLCETAVFIIVSIISAI